MTKFYLYILSCSDKSFYVGQTDNLEKRFNEHDTGKFSGYTHSRRPLILVYHKIFDSRKNVLKAETKVKKWSKQKKIDLINGLFDL